MEDLADNRSAERVDPVGIDRVVACLALTDPRQKCDQVRQLWRDAQVHGLARQDGNTGHGAAAPGVPGRPARPVLVPPQSVPRRRLGSPAGRAALVHAIAHIEFNAINLALDAAWRFPGLPEPYYQDWLSVAADEARHFTLLAERLEELGHAYGDFPAHNGLWEMAEATAHSCLERMALVPRVLEARGLDVTPGMIDRLEAAGDGRTADILRLILAEEVRHVEIGTRWFEHCCAEAGLDPEATFLHLLETRFPGRVRGPFNNGARLAAGFTRSELRALENSPNG